MPLVEVEQGSEEWLQLRRKHITGTDVAGILGISPWKDAYGVWEEKAKDKRIKWNWAMKRGSEEEPIIRSWFENSYGRTFMPAVYTSDDGIGLASLDGIDIGETESLECKFCNKEVFHMIQYGTVPDYYFTQVQWGFFCIPTLKVNHFVGKNSGAYVATALERDEDYLNEILPRIQEFHDKHVLKGIEPTKPVVVPDVPTKEVSSLTERYLSLSDKIEGLIEERDFVKNQLIGMADGKDADFGSIKVTYSSGRKVTDWKKVTEDYKIDVDEYTKIGKPIPTVRRVKK